VKAIAIAGFLVTVACSRSSQPFRRPSAVELISVSGKRLGWGGMFVGETRTAVERALRRALPPVLDSYSDRCGDFVSWIFVEGHPAQITWSDRNPNAVIDIITIPLTTDEVRELRAWPPRGFLPDGGLLRLRSSPDLIISVNDSFKQEAMFIEPEGCVD